ncbi:MAG: substrate-binding domain-containing protein [Bacillota bacterium]
MKKVTQKDIAEALNVSRTTVARALNDSGPVDPQTKKMVIKKAKEFGYEMNPIAKTLAMKKNINIYVFLIESYNKNLSEKIKMGLNSIEKEFSFFNINMHINTTKAENPEKQLDMIKSIISSNDSVDGIIITPAILGNNHGYFDNLIKKIHVPIITVNLDLPTSERLTYIGPDYKKGGAIAAEIMANYLGKKGKIAVLSSEFHYESNDKRLAGFMGRMKKYSGIEIIVKKTILEIEGNYTYSKKIINRNKDIDAIYTTTDISYVNQAIKELEYKNIILIGNDLTPKIRKLIKKGEVNASIHQRPFFQGYLAGKSLFHKIINNKKPKKSLLYTGFDVACQENLELTEMNNLII